MNTKSLFELAFRNDADGIVAAVAAGANPAEEEPSSGHTPLQVACSASALAAVDALLGSGADPNQRFTKRSLVSGVAHSGRVAIMYARDSAVAARLAEAGADVNALDGAGWTALSLAVENCNVELTKTLLALGAARSLGGSVLREYGSLVGLCRSKQKHLEDLAKLGPNQKVSELRRQCDEIHSLLSDA